MFLECVSRVFLRFLRGFSHPENGTSDARTEKAKTIYKKYAPKTYIPHLKINVWQLKSRLSTIESHPPVH